MPQRFLRPGIRSSKRFNRVTWFEQIFYVRLITLVDDYGRYEADPELLQSEAFPFGTPDGKQVQLSAIVSGLASLAGKDLLLRYKEISTGKEYFELTRWTERKRSDSRWPDPRDNICCQLLANADGCVPPKPAPVASESAPVASESIAMPAALDVPEFRELWAKRVLCRKQSRKPMTDTAQEQQLKLCASWGLQKAMVAVAKAIASDWQGIFEPRPADMNGHAPESNQLQETIKIKTL